MSIPTLNVTRAQRVLTDYCLFLLILLVAGSAQAQMGGIDSDPGSPGTGGRNIIEGRIYYPSGRNVDKRMRIRLTGIRGGDFFTMSDDSGTFSFRRIAGGSYVVSIESQNQYEPVNEPVDVIDSGARGILQGRTYTLQITLRLKKSTNKAGVISVALMAAPKAAIQLYQTALEAESVGKSDKALDALRQAVALYPTFPLALNEMGLIYERLGKLDQSAKAFAAAVKVAPEVFELRLNYGLILMKSRQFVQAEAELRSAIQIKDTSTAARLFRGKTLIHLGKYSEAEKELQLVIKLGGDDTALAYRFLGALYNERGDVKQAIEALEKYLSLAPSAKDADNVRQIMKQLRAQNRKT